MTTKESLIKQFHNKDQSFWSIRYDEANGYYEFVNSGHSCTQCTGFAKEIRRMLGGDRVEVMGYLVDDNPHSITAQLDGGHDFALVDDRYIVDPWLFDVAGISEDIVFDLKQDTARILELYGPQKNWELLKE
jgi:hypothetical protein